MKYARYSVQDGVKDSASSVGDYGNAGGHRLDRDDSEILLSGEKKCTRRSQNLIHNGGLRSPKKLNGGPGHSTKLGKLGALAYHDQSMAGAVSCLYGQVSSFVMHETTQKHKMVTAPCGLSKSIDIHWWRDDDGVPLPGMPNARLGVVRV